MPTMEIPHKLSAESEYFLVDPRYKHVDHTVLENRVIELLARVAFDRVLKRDPTTPLSTGIASEGQ